MYFTDHAHYHTEHHHSEHRQMNRLINVDIDGLSSNRLFANDNRTRRNRRDTDMGIKERRTTVLKKEKKNEEKEEKNKTDDDNLDTSSSSRLNTVYNTFPLASVALAELNAALAEVENQDIILLLNSALLIGKDLYLLYFATFLFSFFSPFFL